MARVDDIFQCQWMNAEMVVDVVDDIDVVQTIYVDLGDRWRFLVGKSIFNAR